MSTQQDASSSKGVDSSTPTVDFGYQGSVSRSAGFVHAKPGYEDPGDAVPLPTESSDPRAKMTRLTKKRGSTTPTVDFGYQGPVPRSAGYMHAKPGYLEPGEDIPIPSEGPDLRAKTSRLRRKR